MKLFFAYIYGLHFDVIEKAILCLFLSIGIFWL